MNWQEFLHMGGHAVFVWGSFGAVAVVMVLNAVLPVFKHRKLLAELRRSNGESA